MPELLLVGLFESPVSLSIPSGESGILDGGEAWSNLGAPGMRQSLTDQYPNAHIFISFNPAILRLPTCTRGPLGGCFWNRRSLPAQLQVIELG